MDQKDIGVHDFLGYKGRFPQQRIEKLMNLDRNCGLTSRVLVEGSFIELTSKGLPARQVYLGLTSDELIFVKQEIQQKTNTKNKSDLELEGLVIDAIYPLSNITIVPSNDRLMAFSIVIPGNTVLHFEMCKLDASYRNKWNIWRTLLDNICDRQSMNNSKNSNSTKDGDIQTAVIQSESPSISTSTESDMGVWSVDSEDFAHESFQYGSNPADRLKFLYGGHPIMYRSVYERDDTDTHCVPKSSSWCDITYGVVGSTLNVHVTSFQKILRKRERSNSQIVHTITPGYCAADSDSDSEDEIDAIFDEAINIQQRSRDVRPAAQLWCVAKELTIGKGGGSFNRKLLENAVDHVVFQAISTRKKPIAESILDCRPLEVALELTIMSRGLLMAIRPSDIQQYGEKWVKKVPSSIHNIRRHGDLLCKFVMSEILRSHVLNDRVTTLKFFIDVCCHLLFTEKDFNTLVYILRAMTSLPVYRLKNTWATFFVQEPLKFSVFQALLSLLSPVYNYKSYRTRVNLCNTKETPYVPWFDHFLLYCREHHTNGSETYSPCDTYIAEHKETRNMSYENTIVKIEKGKNTARIAPEVVGETSSGNEKIISILKRKKRKRFHRKLKKLLNILKKKEKKMVTFLLSEMELFREAEHERNDSNMKHLAKTRKYPLDYEISLDMSSALGQFNQEARYQYGEFVRNQGRLSAVQRFSDGLSGEIMNYTLKSISPPVKSSYDTKDVAGIEHMQERHHEISNVGTSKRESEKKDKSKRKNKSPIGWIQNKITHRKDRKKNKADIEHVNVIQTDIDEINNLLEGLPGQNSSSDTLSEDSTVNRKSKNKTKSGDTSVKPKGDQELSSRPNSDQRKTLESRRQSYVPPSVLRNRRKSLFEEAFVDEKDEQADDDFAKSMDKKMMDLKGRRKSVALELLESDENSTLFSERQDQSNNYNNTEVQGHISANDVQHPSIQQDDTRKCTDWSHELIKSISTETIGISGPGSNRYVYCGGDQCIHPKSSVYDQLFLFQKLALDTHEYSCKRVRECLEKLMREVNGVSSFDLFNLSLTRE